MEFLRTPSPIDEEMSPAYPTKSLLHITYNDEDLRSLTESVTGSCSHWPQQEDLLGDKFLQGRLKNDLWALGLPEPDAVINMAVVEDNNLRITISISLNEYLQDPSSVFNPQTLEQLKIKSVCVAESTDINTIRSTASHVVDVLDHHSQAHSHPTPPPEIPLPPFTPLSTLDLSKTTRKGYGEKNLGNITETPTVACTSTSSWTTHPDSESPSPAYRMFLRASSDETLTSVTSSPPSSPPSSPASDQESQIHTHQVPDAPLDTIATQEEIEASFYERMAELEAQHNYEISNVRAEFEELLQERMTEVQAVCNQEVYQLQNLLHAAEDRAQKEHRDKEEAQRKTLESLIPGLDLARLERELHARRLEDKQHELQQREARIAELEARIAELEVLLRDRDPESAIMIATKEREATEPEPEQLRCSICRMENKISELQLQEMELRVQAMGFRAKMSEQREGRLLNELHQERCMRLQAEAELADEAQMRRDAEIAGEVIARDARSPFVVPGLLDAFLKMQGFVG